jgi:hypothetical protein
LEASHGSFSNACHAHIGAFLQTGHSLKLRFNPIVGFEHRFLVADEKHGSGKNRQRDYDEYAKPESL